MADMKKYTRAHKERPKSSGPNIQLTHLHMLAKCHGKVLPIGREAAALDRALECKPMVNNTPPESS